jgi:hypothetical protein
VLQRSWPRAEVAEVMPPIEKLSLCRDNKLGSGWGLWGNRFSRMPFSGSGRKQQCRRRQHIQRRHARRFAHEQACPDPISIANTGAKATQSLKLPSGIGRQLPRRRIPSHATTCGHVNDRAPLRGLWRSRPSTGQDRSSLPLREPGVLNRFDKRHMWRLLECPATAPWPLGSPSSTANFSEP